MKSLFLIILFSVTFVYIYYDIKNISKQNIIKVKDLKFYYKGNKGVSLNQFQSSAIKNILNNRNNKWDIKIATIATENMSLWSKDAQIDFTLNDEYILINYKTKYGFKVQLRSNKSFKNIKDQFIFTEIE